MLFLRRFIGLPLKYQSLLQAAFKIHCPPLMGKLEGVLTQFCSHGTERMKKRDEAVSSSPNIAWNSLFDMWKNNLVIVFRTLVEYTYTFFQCEGTISSSIWKLMRNVFAYFTFRTGVSRFFLAWVLLFFCLFSSSPPWSWCRGKNCSVNFF